MPKSLNYITIVSCLLFLSCSDDELLENEVDTIFYSNPSFKIDGKYDVVRFESVKPIDLNGDGVYSNDVLKEADEWRNSSRYFIEFITERDYNDETLFVPKLFLWAPYQGVISDKNTGKFLYREYGFTNLLARCHYSDAKNKITIWNGNIGEGQILSAVVTNDVMTVKFIQSYYTANDPNYIPNGWERLTIVGTYKRRK